jgi:hypothetical protein
MNRLSFPLALLTRRMVLDGNNQIYHYHFFSPSRSLFYKIVLRNHDVDGPSLTASESATLSGEYGPCDELTHKQITINLAWKGLLTYKEIELN